MKQKTSKNDEEENLSDEDIDEAKSALLSYVSSDDRNEIELSVERETKEFLEEVNSWLESPTTSAPTSIRGMSADYYNKANQIMSYINGKQLQRAQKLNSYASAVEDYMMKRFQKEADELSFKDCNEFLKMLSKSSEDILETARRYNYQIKDLETLTPEANELVAMASTMSPEMLSKLQGMMQKLVFGDNEAEVVKNAEIVESL